ncbi:SMP-30/gluconolactonase/LRE family protein [Flavobacterium selenitireducens]|uniref:SMP-30/gluconolactonase/LRE family protein n=1 Tax=Flavobacterium selenitireducens TaxID=2722704 RepID=UPI00168BB33C|nr:SMP-30/gluconolactonase/LRE family protein [Flavobacterium selenitireducens]MBD3581709.1 gluconolaconase [Flavobacterium selenitireducens]
MKYLLFAALVSLFGMTSAPNDTIEFEAPESYPEGVAYHASNNSYYVSSARFGTIGKVSPDGKYSELLKDNALKSSYGLKISADGKRLYACVSDANYSKFKSPDTYRKMARLIAIDLKTGKKVSDVDLSKLFDGKHFANDLALDNKGNAYITDSFSNVIYKVTPDGKASLFSKSEKFKTNGVGLNGIVWNAGNFLLVASSGKGCVFKVDVANPANVQMVKTDQFFINADGLLLTDKNTLVLVQNGSVNKIHELGTSDNWASAKVKRATTLEQRFKYPSTATANKNDVWVVEAKFDELNDSTTVPSKKFSIQKAKFQAVP